MKSAAIDLTGKRFTRWTVLRDAGRRCRATLWFCRCDCGVERVVGGQSLRRGDSKSCGCYGATVWRDQAAAMRAKKPPGHGGYNTPTYRSWKSMWDRCTLPTATSFQNYGGRGISVCSEWKDYRAFVQDMGPRPPGTTLGRINNDLGYFPSNCEWETPAQQRRNSRQNRFLTFQDETLCLADWAKKIGITPASLDKRISKWPLEKALTHPVYTNKQNK